MKLEIKRMIMYLRGLLFFRKFIFISAKKIAIEKIINTKNEGIK